ncbi:MAG: hypothetical protein KatS3mg102_0739 [Planctomycetota bacterium]|nr:MAG: hypothetical protein KatS3mg102_0739 [Planctomycetota bacterium]
MNRALALVVLAVAAALLGGIALVRHHAAGGRAGPQVVRGGAAGGSSPAVPGREAPAASASSPRAQAPPGPAEVARARAELIEALVRAVPRGRFAPPAELHLVTLHSGKAYVVRVLAQDDEAVRCVLPEGLELRFARAELRALEPYPRPRWEARLLASVERELAAAGAQPEPLELYRLGRMLVENGMLERGRELLAAAVEADPHGLVLAVVCPPPAREALAVLVRARGEPPPLLGTPTGGSEAGTPAATLARPPRLQALAQAAEAALGRAAEHYRQSYAEPQAEHAHLNAAIRELRAALAALEELLAAGAEPQGVLLRMQQAQRLLVDCNKRLTLGGDPAGPDPPGR